MRNSVGDPVLVTAEQLVQCGVHRARTSSKLVGDDGSDSPALDENIVLEIIGRASLVALTADPDRSARERTPIAADRTAAGAARSVTRLSAYRVQRRLICRDGRQAGRRRASRRGRAAEIVLANNAERPDVRRSLDESTRKIAMLRSESDGCAGESADPAYGRAICDKILDEREVTICSRVAFAGREAMLTCRRTVKNEKRHRNCANADQKAGGRAPHVRQENAQLNRHKGDLPVQHYQG